MIRANHWTAWAMLALWIGMISAPAVFGAPECTCPDCTGAFCAMKKHTVTTVPRSDRYSCHEHSAHKSTAFQKGECHHEPGPMAFSYHAILTPVDRPVHQPVQMVSTRVSTNLRSANIIPDTPPPEQPSC